MGRRGHAATSTSCSPTARRSSATPTRRSSRRCSARPRDGTSFGAPTEREVLLAEAIVRPGAGCRAGAPGVERHRGDDDRGPPGPRASPAATSVVKFAGNYHGHGDALLADGRQRRGHPRACPGSAGVTDGAVADTVVVPYNVVPAARRRRGRASSSSRSPPTWAWSPPAPGFLEGLRAECDRRRRAADLRRGDHRLPARPAAARRSASASRPTSACFGKVIGGGLPRRRLRRPARRHGRSSPRSGPCTRRARCRGTRWPRPPASPRSTCSTTPPTRRSRAGAARLGAGARRRRSPAPASPSRCPVVGPLVGLLFGADGAGRLRRRAGAPTTAATPRFFHAMLDRGVALAPGRLRGHASRAWPTTDEVIDEVVEQRRSSGRREVAAPHVTPIAAGAWRPAVDGSSAPTRSCCSAPPATWPRRSSSRRSTDMRHEGRCSTCRSSACLVRVDRRRPARAGRASAIGEHHDADRRGRVVRPVASRLSYVSGDYRDPRHLRPRWPSSSAGCDAPALLPGHPAVAVRRRRRRAWPRSV